jgi:hypothetical protein
MKKYLSLVVASAALVALAGGSAQATPVTFNFAVTNPDSASLTFTDISGLSVKAFTPVGGGATVNSASPSALPGRAFNTGGLGVKSFPGDGRFVDGVDFNDILNLKFSKKVKITAVLFSEIETGDDFGFSIDGGASSHLAVPLLTHVYTFAGQIGKTFGFRADDFNDDFRVKSITVSAVPLPPAMLLFASGLFGIGLLGRRRNKSI